MTYRDKIFFAPCPADSEDLLGRELKELGVSSIKPGFRGWHFVADEALSYRACLELRTASRLLIELFSANALSEEEIYQQACAYPWEEQFSPTATFSCRMNGVPRHKDPRYATLKLKDAIADRFIERIQKRPSVDRRNPDLRFEAYWDGQRLRVYLNWTGPPLHERAYRLTSGPAVLRETSAASFLLRAHWPEIAMGGGALVDPVCGSGTFLVESALMATGVAPGFLRQKWGFQAWRNHDEKLWEKIRHDALDQAKKGFDRLPPIVGFDKDPDALRMAKANLERIGLENKIRLNLQDIRSPNVSLWPSTDSGLLCADPPYGHRLGESDSTLNIYTALGRAFLSLPAQWQFALLAPDRESIAASGLSGGRICPTLTGGMDIFLVLYKSPSTKAADPNKVITGTRFTTEKESIPAGSLRKQDEQVAPPFIDPKRESLKKRLKKNLQALAHWAQQASVSSYRIWDADMPEYNAAVDWYEKRWLHVQEYAAPRTVNPEKTKARLESLLAALKEVTGIKEENIFLKTHYRGKRPYSPREQAHEKFIMRENGQRFYVNFSDYLDVGIFLDHRPTRALLARQCENKNFLNLFAYTGTATVMAAAAGATGTVSVDVSSPYLRWAKENLELNGLKNTDHHFVRSDAFDFLRKNSEIFHCIFIDPPTYSNGTGRQDWSVQKHHGALIRLAMKHLAPEGSLFFAENYRRFSFDHQIKREFLVKEITSETMPPDFARRGMAHRCWEIRAA